MIWLLLALADEQEPEYDWETFIPRVEEYWWQHEEEKPSPLPHQDSNGRSYMVQVEKDAQGFWIVKQLYCDDPSANCPLDYSLKKKKD